MNKKQKSAKKPAMGRKAPGLAIGSTQRTFSFAMDPKNNTKERVAAMVEEPLAVCQNDANLQAMLGVLRNQKEPIEVRLAALQSLQAASFSVVAFESCVADYTASLRVVAKDPNPELRQRVLGILASQKDGLAQRILLDGLKKPESALVPPEKALQFLSYDPHAEAYSVARTIVSKPPNSASRRAALRLLAADAASAPIFEKILRDKSETVEIRQTAATALQALRPEKLLSNARAILLDKSDEDTMHALSLTALTHFGDKASTVKDGPLLKRVGTMLIKKSLKEIASRFLKKQDSLKR